MGSVPNLFSTLWKGEYFNTNDVYRKDIVLIMPMGMLSHLTQEMLNLYSTSQDPHLMSCSNPQNTLGFSPSSYYYYYYWRCWNHLGSPLQSTLIMTMVFGGGWWVSYLDTLFSQMPLLDTRLNIFTIHSFIHSCRSNDLFAWRIFPIVQHVKPKDC